MEREEVYAQLLHILQVRVGQLRVRSPGEAEQFFLSGIDDANPIKELLLLQAQGEDYGHIEDRLRDVLDSEVRGER